ncbi:two-component sensor histidine kinase [Paenibacillus cellulosilyticus]|nr:two-component sensor histidine kinase [Paenibacillus cellulosilyticus]
MILLILCMTAGNLVLLKPFYIWTQTRELEQLSNKLVQENDLEGTAFGALVEEAEYHYQASIDIFDTNGNGLFNSKEDGEEMGHGRRLMKEPFSSKEMSQLDKGGTVTKVHEEFEHNTVNLTVYRKLPDGNIIAITTGLAASEKSVGILNRFLLIVCGLFLLVALVTAIRFATYFSKPIVRLQQLAHRMTLFDFSRGWQEHRRDELGQLGEDMNKLSDIIGSFTRELKEKNEQLEAELERKDRLEQTRKLFVSNVSHELKTPIALIQGYAEGLRQNVNDDAESRTEYSEVIIDEARKMNELVRELLLLSQLEAGQASYYPEPFDLEGSILKTIQRLRKLYSPEQVQFEFEFQPGLGWVIGDEAKINQVINNYMTNAAYFTLKPGVVSVSMTEHNGSARVAVFNSGNSIPEDEMPQIWESFYRADKARTRTDNRTGLGLSIVKGIMDMHGTSYGVYNTNGGVVFWFDLRLAEEGKLQ